MAMARVRSSARRIQEGDSVVDENVMAAHAAAKPMAKAGGAVAASPEAEASPLSASAHENPRVKTLTARLVRALKLEEAGGSTGGVDGLANALARAVLAAEAGGVDMSAGPEDEAAARASPSPAAAAGSSSADVGPPPEYTQQTCYLQTDESEICVYDGVMCYDGKSPIVAVETPVREPERIVDYTHSCSDFRYYEPSAMEYSGCAYTYPFERQYKYEWPMRPASDFPLPLTRRRWGPQNRNGHLYFKEVTPSEIWGAPNAPGSADGRAQGSPGITGEVQAPFDVSPSGRWKSTLVNNTRFPFDNNLAKNLTIAKRTRIGNRTIDWVDGHLWLAGIDGQFWQNPCVGHCE